MTMRRRNEANTPKLGWGAELIEDPQDEDLARNWWAIGLRGVIAIAFGIAALVLPATALFTLVIVFAAYALIDGVSSIVVGVRRPDGGRIRGQSARRLQREGKTRARLEAALRELAAGLSGSARLAPQP